MARVTKTAVVLFNLGGPDSLAAVEPFLFNLFSDPAIIRLPNPFRRLLAKFIAWRRAPAAGEIYKRLGGASPLAANTESQARALERALSAKGAFKVFMAMRYWHPFARETARAVKTYGAARCVLLPLYPQFSSTTTASSLADWERAAKAEGLNVPSSAVCCFPEEEKFIAAHAALIEPLLRHAVKKGPARVLFSAHGLPERVVTAGDPYVFQVEKTVAAIAATLKKKGLLKEADVALSYQSRVGPLKWIGPSIVDEIRRAGRERRNLVVVPVSFVSEHAETLVELDIESKALAAKAGVPLFFRAPALGTHNSFVASLARLVLEAVKRKGMASAGDKRVCPAEFSACSYRGEKP